MLKIYKIATAPSRDQNRNHAADTQTNVRSQTLFRNENASLIVRIGVAEERKPARGQRPNSYLPLLARLQGLFERGKQHLEFVVVAVRICDDDDERLAGGYVNFRRRELMILQCDRIGCKVVGARDVGSHQRQQGERADAKQSRRHEPLLPYDARGEPSSSIGLHITQGNRSVVIQSMIRDDWRVSSQIRPCLVALGDPGDLLAPHTQARSVSVESQRAAELGEVFS